MRLPILAVAALALAGCGTAPAPTLTAPIPSQPTTASATPSGDPIQQIITALETNGPAKLNADLDAATAYATAQGEINGMACFPAVKAWVATLPPLPLGAEAKRISSRPPPIGVVTAIEYARIDRLAAETSVNAWRDQVHTIITSGAPPALELGCGGWMQNGRDFVVRLLAALGLGASAAAIAPAAPMLGPLLPIPITP